MVSHFSLTFIGPYTICESSSSSIRGWRQQAGLGRGLGRGSTPFEKSERGRTWLEISPFPPAPTGKWDRSHFRPSRATVSAVPKFLISLA
jgi:hypothetical protein